MSIALAALESERNGILTEVRDLAAKAQEAGRGFTDDEQATVTERLAKAADLGDQMKTLKAVADVGAQVGELLKAEEAGELNEAVLKGARVGLAPRQKSIAEKFISDPGYKAMIEAKASSNGIIADTTKGISMPPVNIGGFKGLLVGANRTDGADHAGVLVRNDYLGVVDYRAPYTGGIRDLVTVGTTSSDRVEYAQVIPQGVSPTVNAAAGVAEATDASRTTGAENTAAKKAKGYKPQSTMAFQKKSADVITVAHWMAATKRALSDVGQLRTLIDNFLSTGVAREFERQMLSGDKDSPANAQYEEFDGLLNISGVQSQAWAGNVVRTARKILTKVKDAGGTVTAFAVSPAVNEAIDLAQNTQGGFYGGGPFGTGPQTLWGRPRVEVPDLGDDVIIGGEWSTLVLWDREETTLTATDSHEDFFVRNLVAVLAEARAAFGALNPQLMCVGEIDDPEAPWYPVDEAS